MENKTVLDVINLLKESEILLIDDSEDEETDNNLEKILFKEEKTVPDPVVVTNEPVSKEAENFEDIFQRSKVNWNKAEKVSVLIFKIL